ncbi:MAG: cobalt transporter [Firmicutes bacterium]|nr:cobalt transporter [Bacillota bacterium]
MHIVKDENGNLCPHSHEDGHGHTHQHKHDAPCSSDCGSDCNSCGEHDPKKENIALLTYMLQHNEHHAAELDQMADKLRAAGMDVAAEQIRKAVDEFQKGNLYLSVALATVKES